jgi:hypothetical protein
VTNPGPACPPRGHIAHVFPRQATSRG